MEIENPRWGKTRTRRRRKGAMMPDLEKIKTKIEE